MTWLVRLSADARKQVDRPPADRQDQLLRALREMAQHPFHGDVKPLKGRDWKGWYRKRVGRYGIIFLPQHQYGTVDVSAIIPKSEKTYR